MLTDEQRERAKQWYFDEEAQRYPVPRGRQDLRNGFLWLVELILDTAPGARERAMALSKLQEAYLLLSVVWPSDEMQAYEPPAVEGDAPLYVIPTQQEGETDEEWRERVLSIGMQPALNTLSEARR
jgi:hypothetical protein